MFFTILWGLSGDENLTYRGGNEFLNPQLLHLNHGELSLANVARPDGYRGGRNGDRRLYHSGGEVYGEMRLRVGKKVGRAD